MIDKLSAGVDMLATLTSKGQVTLPKEIRDALKLDAGSKLDFVLQPDGSVSFRPLNRSLASLVGLLKRPVDSRSYSIEEQKASVGAALAEKHERILREVAAPSARERRTKGVR